MAGRARRLTSFARALSGVPTGHAFYSVNQAAVDKARELTDARQYVLDSDWGDVQPDAAQENDFLDSHTWDDYSAWHLGLTDEVPDETRGRYAFVYGDFRRVHRTGLIPARYRAAQWRHEQVELAAHDLLQHLDEVSARSLVSPGPPPGRRATRDPGEAGMPDSMKAFVTKGIGEVGIMEKPISEPRSTRLCRGGSERMSRLIERGCVDPTTRRPIATSTRSSGPSR